LEKEVEWPELELIELRTKAELSGALFCREEQRAEDLLHELNRLCSQTQTGGKSGRRK